MKSPRKFPYPLARDVKLVALRSEERRGGFTMIEVMAALAILAIIMLILAQVLGLASSSWSIGKQRVDNLTKARALLDLIAHDVEEGVFRPDLAAFIDQSGNVASSSSTTYAFYTKRTGGGDRNLSLINYQLILSPSSASLQRGALPVGWTNSLPSFAGAGASTVGLPEMKNLTADNYSEVAAGVVAFKMFFINSYPNNSPAQVSYSWNYIPWNYNSSGNQPMTTAVGVTVVVLDDQSQRVLASQGAITGVAANSAFAVPSTLTGSLKDTWDANINTPSFYTSSHYPEQMRTGVKIFERIIPLPPFHQ